jgi:beta-fructofuranosidase
MSHRLPARLPVLSRRNFLAGLGAGAVILSAPKWASARAEAKPTSALARDPLRPQFHLLPAANWMNDPNGPIFFNGRYHMFYQYDPFGAFWGSMHWGHAMSHDMVHWWHERVAMAPTLDGYDRDGVFSGAIVIDPAGHDGGTPTAIYTGVTPPASPSEATLRDGVHSWREVQCLAVSYGGLQTWQKAAQPILSSPPEGLAVTGFRDPCLWREGDEWRMALGSGFAGKGGAILLYRSSDLRKWSYVHPLIEGQAGGPKSANPVDSGEMWECPDFFQLGDRHVLLISTMGKVFWKVGHYGEQRFHPEKEGMVDFGSYYAARSMLDREGNRILWGWIPETRPEAEYRAAGWAGVMSLPRVLTLGSDGGLRMAVAPAVEVLRGKSTRAEDPTQSVAAEKSLAAMRIRDLAAELQFTFVPEASRPFIAELRSERDELFATVAYRSQDTGRELTVNKTSAALVVAAGQSVRLRLLVDGSVLELFANDTAVITERVYVAPQTPLKILLQPGARVISVDLWPMKAISPDRLTAIPPGVGQ